MQFQIMLTQCKRIVLRCQRKLHQMLAISYKLPIRKNIINRYIDSHTVRKLQIGAGATVLKGWLSTDIDVRNSHVIYVNVKKKFPFATNVFDYIYSEHMIEHISRTDGLTMLQECHRTLKPGGIIRIATPDLAVLLRLYQNKKDSSSKEYIQWITDQFLPEVEEYKASIVINNAFRNWGHQFLYDGDLLEKALQDAGFSNIKRCAFGESEHTPLMGIESHSKNVAQDTMVIFETMVYEARRLK